GLYRMPPPARAGHSSRSAHYTLIDSGETPTLHLQGIKDTGGTSLSRVNADLARAAAAYADQWVAYQQDKRDLPGVVVAIRFGDDLLLSRGYGYADLERQIPM